MGKEIQAWPCWACAAGRGWGGSVKGESALGRGWGGVGWGFDWCRRRARRQKSPEAQEVGSFKGEGQQSSAYSDLESGCWIARPCLRH